MIQDLTSLGQLICTDSPTTKLVISGIIKRTDNSSLTSKVSELNATLRQVCTTNNWGYISHENIDRTHLNTSGVHLNKQELPLWLKILNIFLSILIDFLLHV